MIKYLEEFRNKKAALHIADKIKEYQFKRPLQIMEICGGHTITILKFGIHDLLPDFVALKSGPGCPVCVTSNNYIDTALALSEIDDLIITSFGDMIRVPGSQTSLLIKKQEGQDIRVCLSATDALEIAKANPDKEIVFLGIGFETTAPTVASALKTAKINNIKNFSVLSALKTMPEAMDVLLIDKDVKIDGFICPGHVSIITGLEMYEDIVKKYTVPCVITGFEPTDMLSSIEKIIAQISSGDIKVENQYTRAVTSRGNLLAQNLMAEVFKKQDINWRGIGRIPLSGLGINDKYRDFDAEKKFKIKVPEAPEPKGCICGDILKGIKTAVDCPLFAKKCTPEHPVGSCMVSAEGNCAIYYRFGDYKVK